MEIEELIKICKERNEMNFLFSITKLIAEFDSIGEAYSYCNNYTEKMFNNGERHILSDENKKNGFRDEYCQYLEYGSSKIYEAHLKQIGFFKTK